MKTFLTILLSTVLTLSLSAQTFLHGKVTAADTGEELINANLVVEKNGVFVAGVSTDFNGNYSVNLDAAATYDLMVTYLGYPDHRIQSVEIKPGQANRLDVQMTLKNVLLDEIVVAEYKMKCFQTDQSSTQDSHSEINIRDLPTRNVSALAATTTQCTFGAGEVTIRGSRTGATFFTDGARVRRTAAMIPSAGIHQLQRIAGGTPAAFEGTDEFTVEAYPSFDNQKEYNSSTFPTRR